MIEGYPTRKILLIYEAPEEDVKTEQAHLPSKIQQAMCEQLLLLAVLKRALPSYTLKQSRSANPSPGIHLKALPPYEEDVEEGAI